MLRESEPPTEKIETRESLQIAIPTTKVSLKNLRQTFYGDKLLAINGKMGMTKANFTSPTFQMVKEDIREFKNKILLHYLAKNPKSTAQEELLS